MRLAATSLAAIVLLSHGSYWSCDDDHHFDEREDVSVEITGAAGLDFDARFQDDHRTQDVTGDVPFTADFRDQVEFFRAVVDKNSTGSESICVEIFTRHDSKRECTTDPSARVTVTLFF